MTHELEIWKECKDMGNKLKNIQREIKRLVLGITDRYRKRSTYEREKTKVKDAIKMIKKKIKIARICS